jgi:hypothetical protein
MLRSMIFPGAVLSMLAIELAGCGAGRDVEVTGNVSAAATVQVQGPILLEFLDVLADGQMPTVAHTVKLDALGAFTQKVPLEGKQVIVRAINDTDSNGACSSSEAWVEAKADISSDDKVGPVSLALLAAECPK